MNCHFKGKGKAPRNQKGKGKARRPKGKRERSPKPPGPPKEKPHDLAGPKGKREKPGPRTLRYNSTTQPDRAYARTNETKRFPG